MKIHIKNMVCNRCIAAVEQILEKLDIPYENVSLGEVNLHKNLPDSSLMHFRKELNKQGFEMLDDQNSKIIATVKSKLIHLIQSETVTEDFILSSYVQQNLNRDYGHISRLFSQVEGMTLEQYFIQLKIEKVKEWLTYNELTLSEIAWKLGYKSVQHLSGQFRKITGMTPTAFRNLKENQRKPLDSI